MAGRINTKFVVILALTVGAVFLLAAGGMWWSLRTSTEEHIQAGKQAMAEGEYKSAMGSFSRAISDEPTNPDYLDLLESAILKLRPEGTSIARDRYQEWLGMLNVRTSQQTGDPDAYLRLIRALVAEASLRNSATHWKQVAEMADTMHQRVAESDPKHPLSLFYRGFATIKRADVSSEEELAQAEDDLEQYLESYPEDDRGWATLIISQIEDANRERLAGDSRVANQRYEQAEQTLTNAKEAVPGEPYTAIAELRWLSLMQEIDDPAATQEALDQAAEDVAAQLNKTNDPLLIQTALNELDQAGSWSYLTLAAPALETYLEKNPEDIRQKTSLVLISFIKGDYDKAEQLASEVIESEPLTVGLLSRYQQSMRLQNANLLFKVAMARWNAAEEENKSERLAEAEEAKEHMAGLLSEESFDPRLVTAEGRLALARNDYATAASRFEKVIEAGDTTADVYYQSALTLEQMDEVGLAVERIKQATSAAPNRTSYQLEKARLQAVAGQTATALETIEQVLVKYPDNQSALRLKKLVAAAEPDAQASDDPVLAALETAEEQFDDQNFESSRATLLTSLEQYPDDLRLHRTLVALDIVSGNLDQAEKSLANALKLFPNDPRLQGFQATLNNDDVITATKEYLRGRYQQNDAYHAALGITFHQLARQAEATATEQSGEQADKTRQQAERLRTESDKHLANAEQLNPDQPELVTFRFNQALQNKDWEATQRLIEQGTEANIDQANGLLLKGRYELVRERYAEAVDTLARAKDVNSYSSRIRRLLGYAQQQLGQLQNALSNYEEAYTRRPTDMTTVRLYASLLHQTGDTQRALQVLRDARHVAQDNPTIQNLWLQVESQSGEKQLALEKRREIYEENPQDTSNAIQLATLLGQLSPTYEMVTDQRGRMFDVRRWNSLTQDQRNRLLNRKRSEMRQESDEILQTIAEETNTFDVAMRRAMLLQDRGKTDQAEQLLQSFIDTQPEEDRTWRMYANLANFYMRTEQGDKAMDAFDQAIERQDPQQRQGSLALAEAYFNLSQYEQAAQHYETVLEVQDSRPPKLRLAEAYIKIGQFDKARQLLEELEGNTTNSTTELLQASLHEGRGNHLWQQGNKEQAKQAYQKQRAAIKRAQELTTTEPFPYVVEAIALLGEYQRSSNESRINDALNVLDNASRIQPDNPVVRRTRARVLVAKGDIEGAIGELARILENNPGDDKTRRELLSLATAYNRYEQATSVVEDAISRSPEDPFWREELGKLWQRQGDFERAADAYEDAYALQSSELNLTNLTYLLLRLPDRHERIFNGRNGLLDRKPQMVQASPFLISAKAVALNSMGQREAALNLMATSHRMTKQQIESGETNRSMLNSWFDNLQLIFPPRQTEQLEAFVREVTNDQPDAFEQFWLGTAWARLGEQGYSRATELVTSAIESVDKSQKPAVGNFYATLGSLHYTNGNCKAAADAFVKSVENVPNNPPALNNLAYIYVSCLDQPDDALPYAEQAVSLRPREMEYLDTMGTIYLQLDRYEEAEQSLRQSMRIRETATNNLHLAQLMHETNRNSQARTYLRKASELNPNRQTQAEINSLSNQLN